MCEYLKYLKLTKQIEHFKNVTFNIIIPKKKV